MSKTRVFIYGSCVSRDTFEHLDPEQFELVEYVARQSVLSAYTKPVELMAPPTLKSRFQQRMITGDFSSSLRSLMATHGSATDFVLVDLTDERLGAYLLPDGSIVTRSVELIESGGEQYLPQGTQHIAFGTQQHFDYWTTAMEYVGEQMRQQMSQATIVLLDIPWAEWSETGTQTPGSFGMQAAEANPIFRSYVQAAAQALGAHVISMEPSEVVSSPNHPWGDAPFHYAEKVYVEIVKRLTGQEGRVVWGPGGPGNGSVPTASAGKGTASSTATGSTAPESPDLLVTVVVSNNNDAFALGTCLESIQRQSIGIENVEVLVVDNGSTDGTQQILEQYRHRFPLGNFRTISQERAVSSASGRNTAIAEARGEYIYFVNAPDHLGLDALQAMIQRAYTNSSEIVIGKPVGVGHSVPRKPFEKSHDTIDLGSFQFAEVLHAHCLYRTDFLRKNEIEFDTSLPALIERPFAMATYAMAEKVSVESSVDCYYLVRHNNAPSKPPLPTIAGSRPLAVVWATFKAASNAKTPATKRRVLKARYWNRILTSDLVGEFRKQSRSDARLKFIADANRLIGAHNPDSYLKDINASARVFLFLVQTGRPAALEAYLDMIDKDKSASAKKTAAKR
jgi:glycosyltransferase involved in cell wall biosynthesis